MGIRPNRDGLIPPVTPDNPETRYSDWLNDLEDSGEIVGGVWKETDAKATSANSAVGDLAGRVENLETAPVKTHTHVSADITDTVLYSDSTMGIAGRIPRTGTGGWLHSRDNPTHENHLARKGYVDSSVKNVSDRVDSIEQDTSVPEHSHVSADITDAVTYADSTMGQAGRIPRTGTGGFLHQRDAPTHDWHLANKGYVDQQISDIGTLTSASGTGWTAWKRNGVTTLTFNGVTEGPTLPVGYRPPGLIYGVFAYAQDSVGARFNILSNGTVELIGDIPNPAYGTITFVSPD